MRDYQESRYERQELIREIMRRLRRLSLDELQEELWRMDERY